jgi:hypothetical protein
VGESAQLGAGLVDQTVCEEENLHTQSFCDHILCNVIAYHDAFLPGEAELGKDLPVILQIRLAEAGIFIGGVERKILRAQTCPTDATFRSNGREEGVGGKDTADSPLLQQVNEPP